MLIGAMLQQPRAHWPHVAGGEGANPVQPQPAPGHVVQPHAHCGSPEPGRRIVVGHALVSMSRKACWLLWYYGRSLAADIDLVYEICKIN